jgi:hypothetical protein
MAYKKGGGTGGSGEANTASNVGIGGVGLYDAKTGVNLDLRNINAGSSKVSVTLDAPNKEVDIDVVVANLTGIAPSQITGTAVVTGDLASASVLNAVQWNGATKTVSTSAASGGSNGDIWFQYTP